MLDAIIIVFSILLNDLDIEQLLGTNICDPPKNRYENAFLNIPENILKIQSGYFMKKRGFLNTVLTENYSS